MPSNRNAAAIRVNAPLLVESIDAADEAASVTITTGATMAEASSMDARVLADTCATWAEVGGREATTVAALVASGTAGASAPTAVGGSEPLVTDASVGAAVDATGVDDLLKAIVGRGVIVAPVATRGVTTVPLLAGGVGLTVSVAVGDGVRVGVLIAEPVVAEIGP